MSLHDKYNIIYVDLPWRYNARNNPKTKFGTGMHKYPGLSFKELAMLPLWNIAEKNCALCLWATGPKMWEAVNLIQAWGWRYVTVLFVWQKIAKSGMPLRLPGHYAASNMEFVLLGMRGSLPVREKMLSQIYHCWPRKPHSTKPDEIRDRIVRVFGDLPRIELFARKQAPGWDATGLECDGRDIKEVLG